MVCAVDDIPRSTRPTLHPLPMCQCALYHQPVGDGNDNMEKIEKLNFWFYSEFQRKIHWINVQAAIECNQIDFVAEKLIRWW